MKDITTGQISGSAAEIYETFFVPALFAEWSERVIQAADIRRGDRLLDVACGTGILARTAREAVGTSGSVVGLDINDGMLQVAKQSATDIDWRQGRAEAIPFADNYFDVVVSQFGLMFFEDRRQAIREMLRVLRSGQKLVIAVWDTLENTPGYAKMVQLLLRLFGKEAADGLRAPYNLGDIQTLKTLFQQTGVSDFQIITHQGHACFPSIDSWVYTDIKGWVLADMLDDEQFDLLLQEAKSELTTFVQDDGSVIFDAPAHIITVTKP